MRSPRALSGLGFIGVVLVAVVTAVVATPPESDSSTNVVRPLHGVVVPASRVTLAATLDGRLAEVLVEAGRWIGEDAAAAVIDDRVARASVAVAQIRADSLGGLEHARRSLEHARTEHERITRLHASGAASDHELVTVRNQLDLAHAAVQVANESLAVARADLELQRELLERHTIRTPFAGVVVRTHGRVGEMMEASQPVLELVALDTLEVELHLPVTLYGRLEVGREYRLHADAPVGTTLPARLRTIDPIIDPASRTFRCVFDIANLDRKLPAGFTVTLAEQEVERMASAEGPS